MGGIQYPNLNKVAFDIWQWCEHRKLWIFASYIKSCDNIDADRESRVKNVDTEWEIAEEVFEYIVHKLGFPEVDLFASRENTKCEKFFSWKPDPEAIAVDAFTQDWQKVGFFWAFPPFSLILRVIQKIRLDKATGIVVVPNWPNQPWFPLFYDTLISESILIEPSPNLLLSPCRSLQHPLAENLELIAGILSGDRSSAKAHQTKQSRYF